MNSSSSNRKFRKTLFWLTTIFLGIHIVLCSLVVFVKVDFLPAKLNSFYSRLIILGPFFSADRISSSPHLYVSTFSPEDGWSPFRDIAHEHFVKFQQHPWRYNELKWSDCERYLAYKSYDEIKSLRIIDGSEGTATVALMQYMNMCYSSVPDSIRLVYVWNIWQPQSRSIKVDTAFNVVFKPKKGCSD